MPSERWRGMDKQLAVRDIVAVNLRTSIVRLIGEIKTPEGLAEAIVEMAVMRRGVDEEFFADVPHGQYKNGDIWRGIGTDDKTIQYGR